jgi:hypothetical protein
VAGEDDELTALEVLCVDEAVTEAEVDDSTEVAVVVVVGGGAVTGVDGIIMFGSCMIFTSAQFLNAHIMCPTVKKGYTRSSCCERIKIKTTTKHYVPPVFSGGECYHVTTTNTMITSTYQNCSGTAPPSGLTSPQCPVDMPVLPPHRSGQLYSKYPSW